MKSSAPRFHCRLNIGFVGFSAVFSLLIRLFIIIIRLSLCVLFRDEMSLDGNETLVGELFERAIVDYLSFDIWLEYCQWACGTSKGVDYTRNVTISQFFVYSAIIIDYYICHTCRAVKIFERAVSSVGIMANKGSLIWMTYREFEMAIYSIDPSAEQRRRIDDLFRRQLKIPLCNMEETLKEYTEFCAGTVFSDGCIAFLYRVCRPKSIMACHSRLESGGVGKEVLMEYELALNSMKTIQLLEDQLELAPSPAVHEYFAYIDFEIKGFGISLYKFRTNK